MIPLQCNNMGDSPEVWDYETFLQMSNLLWQKHLIWMIATYTINSKSNWFRLKIEYQYSIEQTWSSSFLQKKDLHYTLKLIEKPWDKAHLLEKVESKGRLNHHRGNHEQCTNGGRTTRGGRGGARRTRRCTEDASGARRTRAVHGGAWKQCRRHADGVRTVRQHADNRQRASGRRVEPWEGCATV